MGNLASPEALLARRHGLLQAAVVTALDRRLKTGVALTECPILTAIGIRVPDVVWASKRFMTAHRGLSPLPSAPEICIEVLSRSNVKAETREKARAYLAAGAQEVWVVAENGRTRIVDGSGTCAQSRFPIVLKLPDPTKGYP